MLRIWTIGQMGDATQNRSLSAIARMFDAMHGGKMPKRVAKI